MNKREIRKKMIMDLVSHPDYKPMKSKEILALFGMKKKEAQALEALLEELVLDGKIMQTARAKYMVPLDDMIKTGKFIGHPSGFGFVEIEDLPSDIFIPAFRTGGAFHGDTVRVRIMAETAATNARQGKRVEGEIVKVLKRGFSKITGLYEASKGFGFVIPDVTKIGTDIYIGKNLSKNAKNGDKVVVQIIDYGLAGEKPRGEVVEVLGSSSSVEVDITSIARTYDLPQEFSQETLDQVKQIPVEIDKEEYQKRLDLRKQLIITIDGEDAKDLDDAISIEKIGDSFRLGVHIADVSHYVEEYSPLDFDAVKRGTSHYLVDRVIPMLPKELSNGLCSLNPNEDRLTLSCIMNINHQGKVFSHEIKESIIRSSYRMTYTEVAKILEPERCSPEEKEALFKKYEDLIPSLYQMAECAGILNRARKQRGAIDFDFTEAKFILNEDSSVKEIKAYDRNVATRLIEDFMLVANETVAEHFFWQGIPFLYRSHGEPKEDKIADLSAYLKALDYPFKRKAKLHPKDLQNLLGETEGKPEENIIRRMVLRSMQQARYTESNDGHFGLATKYYTHFTSPIRRYPDLQIHRIIKEVVQGKWKSKRQDHYLKRLPNVAVKTSAQERKADEAERDVHKLLKALYMENYIGESFEGIVSGVTEWGIFVELANTVEGLVSVNSLKDDFYEYDSNHMMLVGTNHHKTFRLGDRVAVVVTAVDKARKVVDFKLYDENKLDLPVEKGFKVEEKIGGQGKQAPRPQKANSGQKTAGIVNKKRKKYGKRRGKHK